MRRSPEFPAGMAFIPLSFAYPMLKFIARRRLFYVHLFNIVVCGIFLNIASVLGPDKKSAVLPGAEIYDCRLV